MSGHPLDAHTDKTAKAGTTIAQIRQDPKPGFTVILPVLVDEVKTLLTKKGEKMAFLKVSDKSDAIEAVIFPKTFQEHQGILTVGTCLLIKANISGRNGETSLSIENLKLL